MNTAESEKSFKEFYESEYLMIFPPRLLSAMAVLVQ